MKLLFPLALADFATNVHAKQLPVHVLADCDLAPYSKLDFLLGEWEVHYTGSERMLGFSSISRNPADECAVTEELSPETAPQPIEFITRFDIESSAFRQVIFGMSPTHIAMDEVQIEGAIGFEGKVYTLSNPDEHRLLRLVYTALPEGGFRHEGYVSADNGENWRRTADLTYTSIRDVEQ